MTASSDAVIRLFHPSDMPALYRICLLTGDNGLDASARFTDPDLLGHYFAGPYGQYAPETCLVLESGGKVSGYMIGCLDTAAFAAVCEKEWFPALRNRYTGWVPVTDSDRSLVNLINEGLSVPDGAQDYPAHLHIDLLPEAQGAGQGKKLMDAFVGLLEQKKCPGLHLGVSGANTRAQAFYTRYGFTLLQEHPGWNLMGLKLSSR